MLSGIPKGIRSVLKSTLELFLKTIFSFLFPLYPGTPTSSKFKTSFLSTSAKSDFIFPERLCGRTVTLSRTLTNGSK